LSDDTEYSPATPHGEIEELFPNLFFVQGSITMGPGVRFNRNMVIVRRGDELTLVSSVRLSGAEESRLESLGRISHVVRIGNFHGVDDQYYVDRYGAKFWCQPGSGAYSSPAPDHLLAEGSPLPVEDASLFVFRKTKHPECALLLEQDGGVLVTADSVQHWTNRNYCNLRAKIMMPILGPKMGTILGPPWRKVMTPDGDSLEEDFRRLLDLEFRHHVGAHGGLCRESAHEGVAAAVKRAYS
jgi:hypothetical protein